MGHQLINIGNFSTFAIYYYSRAETRTNMYDYMCINLFFVLVMERRAAVLYQKPLPCSKDYFVAVSVNCLGLKRKCNRGEFVLWWSVIWILPTLRLLNYKHQVVVSLRSVYLYKKKKKKKECDVKFFAGILFSVYLTHFSWATYLFQKTSSDIMLLFHISEKDGWVTCGDTKWHYVFTQHF